MKKLVEIITSGTGIERASKSFIGQNINDVLSVSYTEMLLSKSGHSKYLTEEFIDELDPIKNKSLISFLKSASRDKPKWMQTLSYAPNINFWKLTLPDSHRKLIHSIIDDDDLTGWSKMLSDVNKNQNIIKSIINGLWGKAGIKDDALNTLSISNAIGRDPKVVQFFVATPSKKELVKLTNLFKLCLPNHIIRPLSGIDSITNSTAEKIVKSDIEECRDRCKDGVVVLSMNMGSRSFSVSETDAVVLLFDNGSVGSLIQKISRALTGGKLYDGSDKKCGNVISLSLDPNRIDSVDIFVVEEGQKNKSKSENFISAVRRIRRSVNIFSIDENGDKISLLDKDEYYSELMEKFNFDKLKNSQINLIPLISDFDLISSLSDIKNSNSEKNKLKKTELKGKGRKFLDGDKGNDENEDPNDDDTLSDKDIDFLKKCIVTINNSIISIAGIDDSNFSKKSFRKTLDSINYDLDKKKEFVDLLGISPSVVVKLLDKQIINENIIDICLSSF